jgi:hypothetical protein
MDYPGSDPMNENSPLPALARSLQTGVNQVPYSILNGMSDETFRYDYSIPSERPTEAQINEVASTSAPFALDLEVQWGEESLDAWVTATCEVEAYNANLQLYVVVLETSVTAYTGSNGDIEFRNVVLDMLPSPAGTLWENSWSEGQSLQESLEWEYASFVEHSEELALVAFITDRDKDGEILQAARVFRTPTVSSKAPILPSSSLAVFPNPVSDVLYVNLGEDAREDSRLVITDLAGKRVLEKEVGQGYRMVRLDPTSLPGGMYIVSWIESGMLKGRVKVVKN